MQNKIKEYFLKGRPLERWMCI